MAITVPRYRILPLRGTYDALVAEFDEINDNEICYAIDRDQYYQREGNQLVQVGATKVQGALAESAVQPVDLAPVAFSGDYNDLASRPNVLEVGDNISLLTNNVNYITEAPANGNQYARQNGTWTVVQATGTGDVEEAPLDGAYYVRQNGTWINEDELLLFRYVINTDGGDYGTGEARGAFVTLDPGDFDTGISDGIDQTVNGGIFT